MSNAYQTPESNLVNDKVSTGNSDSEKYGSVEKAIHGEYSFSIGAVISEAWTKTKGSKWIFNLSFVFYFLVIIIVMTLMEFITVSLVSSNAMGGDPSQMVSGMMFVPLALQLSANLIILPMVMGLAMMGIKRSVDAPISSGMVFKYFPKMLPLFVTMLLIYIMVIIGFILFVLPGIYLMIAYYMAMPLVAEKGLSPWQAMEASRKAITHRWFSIFGFFITMLLIIVVSALPLGIGMIWTMPMMVIAFAILYRNMFGVNTETVSQY